MSQYWWVEAEDLLSSEASRIFLAQHGAGTSSLSLPSGDLALRTWISGRFQTGTSMGWTGAHRATVRAAASYRAGVGHTHGEKEGVRPTCNQEDRLSIFK